MIHIYIYLYVLIMMFYIYLYIYTIVGTNVYKCVYQFINIIIQTLSYRLGVVIIIN